jgi:hypothetical protein
LAIASCGNAALAAAVVARAGGWPLTVFVPPDADPTGSSGLGGLLDMRRSGTIGDQDRVAVLFTGIQR